MSETEMTPARIAGLNRLLDAINEIPDRVTQPVIGWAVHDGLQYVPAMYSTYALAADAYRDAILTCPDVFYPNGCTSTVTGACVIGCTCDYARLVREAESFTEEFTPWVTPHEADRTPLYISMRPMYGGPSRTFALRPIVAVA